jgi:signal transduction histidine kinase
MVEPAIPDTEAQRLASLERYAVMDTPNEVAFERMVRLVARIFEVPVAMVTFIGRDRQWFKACIGTDLRENTRALSFCSYTILTDGVMVVPDALEDVRFRDNPIVLGLGVRFYAGAPLRTSDGHNIGTLCIYDFKPRPDLTPAQRETITELAASVIDDLEARLTAERATKAERALAAVNRELSERLEQLNSINAAQLRFVEDVSHELRTPFTLIQGNIELVLRYPDLDIPERTHALTEATQATERLGRLVSDMLHLVRNNVRQPDTHARLDFAQLMRSSLEQSRPLAHAHVLTSSIESTGFLVGHADRLRQLVTILIDNACKYTPVSGRVNVVAVDHEDEIELRVEDTGVGIGEHELELVFDRFYRSKAASSDDTSGTGLGLPIARAIAQSHGGRIWMESSPGHGSRAIVRLPREL